MRMPAAPFPHPAANCPTHQFRPNLQSPRHHLWKLGESETTSRGWNEIYRVCQRTNLFHTNPPSAAPQPYCTLETGGFPSPGLAWNGGKLLAVFWAFGIGLCQRFSFFCGQALLADSLFARKKGCHQANPILLPKAFWPFFRASSSYCDSRRSFARQLSIMYSPCVTTVKLAMLNQTFLHEAKHPWQAYVATEGWDNWALIPSQMTKGSEDVQTNALAAKRVNQRQLCLRIGD